jgi:hypothetical protein
VQDRGANGGGAATIGLLDLARVSARPVKRPRIWIPSPNRRHTPRRSVLYGFVASTQNPLLVSTK